MHLTNWILQPPPYGGHCGHGVAILVNLVYTRQPSHSCGGTRSQYNKYFKLSRQEERNRIVDSRIGEHQHLFYNHSIRQKVNLIFNVLQNFPSLNNPQIESCKSWHKSTNSNMLFIKSLLSTDAMFMKTLGNSLRCCMLLVTSVS